MKKSNKLNVVPKHTQKEDTQKEPPELQRGPGSLSDENFGNKTLTEYIKEWNKNGNEQFYNDIIQGEQIEKQKNEVKEKRASIENHLQPYKNTYQQQAQLGVGKGRIFNRIPSQAKKKSKTPDLNQKKKEACCILI